MWALNAKSVGVVGQQDDQLEVLGVNTPGQFVSNASLPSVASHWCARGKHDKWWILKPLQTACSFESIVHRCCCCFVVNLNGRTHVLVHARGLNNKTRLSELWAARSVSHKSFFHHVGTEISSEMGGNTIEQQLKHTSLLVNNNVLHLQLLLDQSADLSTSTVPDISTLHQPPVGFLLFVTDAATM